MADSGGTTLTAAQGRTDVYDLFLKAGPNG